MTTETTLPVLSSAHGGSETADAAALYRTHADFLLRLLFRLGVRDPDVDDLLHDVFVTALRQRSKFEGRSTARTWLCGIAVRLASEHRRRRRVREFFGLSRNRAGMGSPTMDPEHTFEQAESRREVQEILDRLSPHKRSVLVLFEVEQLSGEEIAQILGCPVKTVWTRLFYARQDFVAELNRRALIENEASGFRSEKTP